MTATPAKSKAASNVARTLAAIAVGLFLIPFAVLAFALATSEQLDVAWLPIAGLVVCWPLALAFTVSAGAALLFRKTRPPEATDAP